MFGEPCHDNKLTSLLPVILGAAATLVAAFSAGRVTAANVPAALSLSLGAVVVSYGVFALMLLHAASRPAVLIWLAVCAAPGLLRRWRPLWIGAPPTPLLLVFGPFLVWYLVHALAPEVRADPNIYHLQPALDALQHGGFTGAIGFYNRLPQGVEMLFVPAWLVGGASAAKLVHFAFLLATLPLVAQLAELLGLSRAQGWFAAAIYFCTPIVGVAGTAAFNDAALVYFSLAAVVFAVQGMPVSAGVAAGFCYAVKMTGLLTVPVVMAFFIARRQWRAALYCGAVAALVVSPWLVRNLADTGNPLAPFGNSWFPNPYFYPETEELLRRALRDYGVPFWRRFPEVLTGDRLQGLVGPMWALAPFGLLAAWRRSGLLLLALASVLSIPWWMNAGARFLMPALPFVALAMSAVLPVRAVWVLVALCAVTSWPQVVFAYSPMSIRFETFPWRAALRLESEEAYLRRVSDEFLYVDMVEKHTPPGARVFDLVGAHAAHTQREFVGYWQSAFAVRSMAMLEFARDPELSRFAVAAGPVGASPVCGVRVSGGPMRIHSVDLVRDGVAVENHRGWTVSSNVNIWDAPLAFDGSPVSFWSPWRDVAAVDLDAEMKGGVAAEALRVAYSAGAGLEAQVRDCGRGAWSDVPVEQVAAPPLNFRAAAVSLLKARGITHLLVSVNSDGSGVLATSLVNEAHEWNLEVAASLHTIHLLRIL